MMYSISVNLTHTTKINACVLGMCAALVMFCAGCSNQSNQSTNESEESPVQEIVDHAILMTGGHLLQDAEISFDFRDRSYRYKRTDGLYEYQRLFIDEQQDTLLDILTNEGLVRLVNGQETELDPKKRQAYSNSVNSVIYFALLPFGLNDEAVVKTYEGEIGIDGKDYFQVRVAFEEEGGGVDYEDNFLYWFDMDDSSMDYFAYDYVTDGGGVRFREAYNTRKVGGVTFQDYRNYKPASKEITLEDALGHFQADSLILLSTIELKNIEFHEKNK